MTAESPGQVEKLPYDLSKLAGPGQMVAVIAYGESRCDGTHEDQEHFEEALAAFIDERIRLALEKRNPCVTDSNTTASGSGPG